MAHLEQPLAPKSPDTPGIGGIDPREPKAAAAAEKLLHELTNGQELSEDKVRERLAVPEHEWQAVQRKIPTLPDIKEAAIISTCNRHEIYFVTPVITFSSRNQRPIPYACSVQKNCADIVRAGLPQGNPACDKLPEHSTQRVKAGAAGQPVYADRG